MYKPTKDFDEIEAGLLKRGFVGMNNIDSLGRCHKNEIHFVLRTDGLIIYSNFANAHMGDEWLEKASFKAYRETWGMEEFTFEKLDEVMAIVDL